MYSAPSISFRQVVAALSGCLCCVLGALSTATAADDLTAPESLAGYRFVNAFVVTDQQNPLFAGRLREHLLHRVPWGGRGTRLAASGP